MMFCRYVMFFVWFFGLGGEIWKVFFALEV